MTEYTNIEGKHILNERPILYLSETIRNINIDELVCSQWTFKQVYPQNTNTEAKEGKIAYILSPGHQSCHFPEGKHLDYIFLCRGLSEKVGLQSPPGGGRVSYGELVADLQLPYTPPPPLGGGFATMLA